MITTVVNTLDGFLLPFAEHYRGRGWTVDALARGATESRACRRFFNQVWDAEWTRNPLHLASNRAGARQVSALAGNGKYDIVHVHTPIAGLATRWALRSRPSRTKLVYTAHGFHFYRGAPWPKHVLFGTAEKYAAPWTDALVVINREDEEAALAWGTLDRNRIFYLPGIGLDLEIYNRERVPPQEAMKLKTSLGIPAESFLFLALGELTPRKCPGDVIAAFARTDEQCRLIFAGEGPLRADLERQAAALSISNRIVFLGQFRDVPCLLRASDALILASRQEGLPRCVLEAMAMGIPVIGTNIRGTADLLASGAGTLVELGDVEGLYQAMKALRANPHAAALMAEIGQRAALQYDLKAVLSKHDDMYEQLLASTPAYDSQK